MSYVNFVERPTLRRPVLVIAFTGWVDGGQASTTAVRFLVDHWGAKKLAEVDIEDFYNFTRVRPQVQLEPDFSRKITWPETTFYYHADPELDRDYVLLLGIEPNFKWRTFSEEVLGVCQAVGVVSAISLGGVIADVPHTRRPRITVTSSDPELTERFPELGRRRGGYQGPTGIIGVIADKLTRADIPVSNIRGPVPHYIATLRNPKVSHALLTRLGQLYGLKLDLSDLEQRTRRFERRVNASLADRPELVDYVKDLEGRSEEVEPGSEPVRPEGEPGGGEELPSGQDIVRELEEFFRNPPTGQGGEPSERPEPS